jgi:hypothetical protein
LSYWAWRIGAEGKGARERGGVVGVPRFVEVTGIASSTSKHSSYIASSSKGSLAKSVSE